MDSVYSVNSSLNSDYSSRVKSRRERIENWLNQKTNYDTSSAASSESAEKTDSETDTKTTPFERLVKNIKTSDLTLSDKKQQIHYAKYALMQMNDEQASTFEKSMKTLISLKEQNQSGQYDAVLNSSNYDYSDEIAKAVKKLNALKEKISEEKKSLADPTDSDSSMDDKIKALLKSSTVSISEALTTSVKSYSSLIIDQYVETLNKNYETIVSPAKATPSSVDVVA